MLGDNSSKLSNPFLKPSPFSTPSSYNNYMPSAPSYKINNSDNQNLFKYQSNSYNNNNPFQNEGNRRSQIGQYNNTGYSNSNSNKYENNGGGYKSYQYGVESNQYGSSQVTRNNNVLNSMNNPYKTNEYEYETTKNYAEYQPNNNKYQQYSSIPALGINSYERTSYDRKSLSPTPLNNMQTIPIKSYQGRKSTYSSSNTSQHNKTYINKIYQLNQTDRVTTQRQDASIASYKNPFMRKNLLDGSNAQQVGINQKGSSCSYDSAAMRYISDVGQNNKYQYQQKYGGEYQQKYQQKYGGEYEEKYQKNQLPQNGNKTQTLNKEEFNKYEEPTTYNKYQKSQYYSVKQYQAKQPTISYQKQPTSLSYQKQPYEMNNYQNNIYDGKNDKNNIQKYNARTNNIDIDLMKQLQRMKTFASEQHDLFDKNNDQFVKNNKKSLTNNNPYNKYDEQSIVREVDNSYKFNSYDNYENKVEQQGKYSYGYSKINNLNSKKVSSKEEPSDTKIIEKLLKMSDGDSEQFNFDQQSDGGYQPQRLPSNKHPAVDKYTANDKYTTDDRYTTNNKYTADDKYTKTNNYTTTTNKNNTEQSKHQQFHMNTTNANPYKQQQQNRITLPKNKSKERQQQEKHQPDENKMVYFDDDDDDENEEPELEKINLYDINKYAKVQYSDHQEKYYEKSNKGYEKEEGRRNDQIASNHANSNTANNASHPKTKSLPTKDLSEGQFPKTIQVKGILFYRIEQ